MVILNNDCHPKNKFKRKSVIPHFESNKSHHFLVQHFVKTERSNAFELICENFFACYLIDLCSSFKFRAPKQIWNSSFSYLPKRRLEDEGILREMNELSYFLTCFWDSKNTLN